MQPYEIIAAPLTLYLAPVGTAFPLIDAAPAVDWVQVGTAGDRSETEEGVTVSHSQAFNLVRSAGSTGARKALRTEEDLIIGVTLMDLSLEQYKLALNGNAVTTTAAGVGTAGFKSLKMYRGLEVETMALLARGKSPYGDNYNMQLQVPFVFQSGSPEPVFTKGDPSGLALEYTALEDPAAATAADRFGKIVAMHAAALEE